MYLSLETALSPTHHHDHMTAGQLNATSCLLYLQYRQAVSKTPSMRHQRSFSTFGFGANSSGSTVGSVSGQSRRGSQINVNVTPSQPQETSSDTPEIRKYKKRFNSDILCASLWGKYIAYTHTFSVLYLQSTCISILILTLHLFWNFLI